jgi:hypothetical protein
VFNPNNNNLTQLLEDNDRDLTDGSLNSESVSRQEDSDIGQLVSVIEKQTTTIQQAIELFTVNMTSLMAASSLSEEGTIPASPTSPSGSTLSATRKEEQDLKTDGHTNDDSEDKESQSVTTSPEEILVYIQQLIDDMIQHSEEEETRGRMDGDTDTDSDTTNSLSALQRGFSSIIMYIQKIIDNPNISR